MPINVYTAACAYIFLRKVVYEARVRLGRLFVYLVLDRSASRRGKGPRLMGLFIAAIGGRH